MQANQGISMSTYETKPRVRARRGQATDPHSIAERLRRERIADRMKALQELVPNSNKTDKASMLDEIIEYVKFLQLQVKVLSMSRLGGTAAVAPLVADLPAEGNNSLIAAALGQIAGSPQDVMALAEREVASLMEKDMGTAMQYLQSKGLCLMPVSLATAISTINARQGGGTQGGEQGLTGSGLLQMGSSPSSFLAGSCNTLASSALMPSAGDCSGMGTAIEGTRNQIDNMQTLVLENMNESASQNNLSAAIGGLKSKVESSTRCQ